MKVISVIPARGGSKGIPLKNIVSLNGEPLISYTIEASKQSNVDETWVSTDSPEIASVALECGAKIIERPSDISTDTSQSEEALLHMARETEFDVMVFIQPTSPLIISKDVNKGIKMMTNYDSVLSVTENNQLSWSNNNPLYDISNRKRRQDSSQSYLETGGIFITTKLGLIKSQNRLNGKIGLLKLPKIRSFDTLNLDISILVNLLNCNDKLEKILFLSSAAVYKNVLNKTNREDTVKSNIIINKIINFINDDYLMGKKLYKEFLFTKNKLVDKTIDPFFHKNDNLRLNGITKLISEKILKEYCHENKIELQILRPYRII